MFKRKHHLDIALVLQALDPKCLAEHHCYFGGGTAMVLQRGEYRQSDDINFLVSDLQGYRALRQMLGGAAGLAPIAREGLAIELEREIRADQYGVRTRVRAGESVIKFEIVLEGRIRLEQPARADKICGLATLRPLDMASEKLLANADRWRDDAVYSRDIIDLAMLEAPATLLEAACTKAETAYGNSVRKAVADAIHMLKNNPKRLDECMQALSIEDVAKQKLWSEIRRLGKVLPERDGEVEHPQQRG
ncbi:MULTISPECIES: nucleotidyl transferase AbiEii/AbiGii toxin family protein [Ramlibacter]|uniref:Nucleotidyl transferase AbiEii/AbiGii toxin family protein n=1 Tax=Ramlibacter aquaticus TaxID=2780094 RepID=A0ABR9SJC1_9BURK|nr:MULTISPECIES: nucleotidyl transferase AbiEii/AbiGii toxin family protein [Ramlibacter]MBE7942365.1 nucleotidyl transferase AbiEii/AbiGii toxin family protein [Ramlibacter aquaticus]